MDEARSGLKRPEFPRSRRYDVDWMLDNQMGPNALWLVEWLCERTAITDENLHDPSLGVRAGVDR